MVRQQSVQGIILSLLFLVSLTCCRSASAQEGVVYNPGSGTYTVEYVDDAGVARTAELVPPNHVDPTFLVEIEEVPGGGFVYSYTMHNMQGAGVDQAIEQIEMDCPAGSDVLEVTAPESWSARHLTSGHSNSIVCRFRARADRIPPGGVLDGFRVEARSLPGVVRLAVWGNLADGPESFPGIHDARPALAELAAEVQGVLGGWLEAQVVGPVVPPEDLANPIDGVVYLSANLGDICTLEWIDNSTGVCNSLEVKLEQVEASIVNDRPAARNQLQSFLSELDAQRGQHVTENAYWLLQVLGEHVLSTI